FASWKPPRRLQSDADINRTKPIGTTKSITTSKTVGLMNAQPRNASRRVALPRFRLRGRLLLGTATPAATSAAASAPAAGMWVVIVFPDQKKGKCWLGRGVRTPQPAGNVAASAPAPHVFGVVFLCYCAKIWLIASL